MARLRAGEKDTHSSKVHRLLRRHTGGLTEQEMAEMIGMHRRRLNNYLRELQEKQKAYRERRLWFADD